MYKIIGADKKEYGPITGDLIRQWIAEGRLNANTQARAEGATDWQPLAAFPEFAAALGITPAAATAGAFPGQLPAGGGRETALQAVKGPAIGLKVTAIIGLVLVAFSMVVNILSLAGMQFNFGMPQTGDPQVQQFQKMFGRMGGGLGIVSNLVAGAVGVVILIGASKMQRLQNYQMAMTASILAMLPCISPCCILGLPFGIWALVVLNKSEVKSQFT